ncbi:LacI family DNA-binding transcriptional regulator [Mycobacterium sp. NPDC048908]|uniref:LacI family DNA-binding transcriptional regulator n=1 Tax=Mycobacterium sp. NPDC048908 TaxID=3364292 RepID=UPI00371631D0
MAGGVDRPGRRREGRPVNMFDVAKAAGVSHQTVSRVLNDSAAVKESTRRRVNAAIDELGYHRNLAARALATHRSNTLGVICFDSTLYGPASMLYAIEHAARGAGYFVSVASESTIDSTTLPRTLNRLTEQSVEGVVVIAPLSETHDALSRLRRDIPVVAVDATGGLGLPVVSVDQFDGARQVTRHLLEQGASTVWHVTGAEGWTETEARLAGWHRELTDAARAIPEPLHGNWSPASGYQAGIALARRADVEAVFVANDQMALGVLRAFAEAGRAVPDDVLVAGFDDVPEAEFYSPPLTTVRQDFTTVGRTSVEMLLARIEGTDSGSADDQPTLVPAQLVVRQSTRRS